MGLLTEGDRREAWLAERKLYVTSTDVPILFGQGYSGSSPARLYGEKRGIIQSDPPSPRMRLGRAFQDGITSEAALQLGQAVVTQDQYKLFISPKHPWLASSLDGIAADGRVVEIKLHGDYVQDVGSLPHGWLFQVQTQLMVTGAPGAVLAVCERGVEVKLFDLLPDVQLQAEIEVRSKVFYDYLSAQLAPPPEWPGDNDGLTALYRYLGDPARPAEVLDFSFLDLAEQRRDLLLKKKTLYDELDMVEATIKYAMGEATTAVIHDTDVKVTWKTTNRKDGTSYRQLKVYGLSKGV